MIKRRYCQAISSNTNCFSRFRHLRVSFMAAPASNFTLGQTDFNMCFRRLNCNLSANRGRIFAYGFSLKGCCSNNYANVFRSNSDCVGGNDVQKARAYGPSFPQLLRVSEEVVRADDQGQSGGVNGGASLNRWNFAGALNQPLPEKITIAVDVDEVLRNFVSALNRFIADRYSLNHSVSEYHVYEFFKVPRK